MQQRAERRRRFGLHVRQDVRVDVERHGDVRMSADPKGEWAMPDTAAVVAFKPPERGALDGGLFFGVLV